MENVAYKIYAGTVKFGISKYTYEDLLKQMNNKVLDTNGRCTIERLVNTVGENRYTHTWLEDANGTVLLELYKKEVVE